MGLPIADRWFDRKRIDDEITLLWEPHVDPLLRCNIWHVRGRDRDAMIDSGLGIASLKAAADDLLQKEVVAVATHVHYDHVGGLHEFDNRVMHRIEAPEMADYGEPVASTQVTWVKKSPTASGGPATKCPKPW